MIRLVLQHQKHDILNIKTEESLVFSLVCCQVLTRDLERML